MGDLIENTAEQVAGTSLRFIDTFCDPSTAPGGFRGQLGGYTPCVTDVVVLGVAHLTAIVLCSARLVALFRRKWPRPQFKLLGPSRAANVCAVLASLACLLIVLFQVNARVASQAALGLASGRIAPYEGGGYAVATVSWALFALVYAVELGRYSMGSTYFVRFSILFVAAGQVAKLRLVLSLSERRDYFFVLFVVYVALQLLLAGLALLHWPQRRHLALRTDDGYMALGPEAEEEQDVICPESAANPVSYLTFSWVGKLMRQGYRRPLQFEDVWPIPARDAVVPLCEKLNRNWDVERATKEVPSLPWTLWRTVRWQFLGALPFKLVTDAAQFVGPVFLNLLVTSVATGGSQGLAYGYSTLMLLGLICGTLADNQHYQLVMRGGYQMRAILVHEVFKKVLALTPSARNRFTSGFIFNLVTSDTEQLQLLCQNVMGLISCPIRIIVAVALLYQQLNIATLVAVAILVIFIPVQAWMVRRSSALLKASLVHTDERAKVESELLAGIEVVKCSTWESSFWDRICITRDRELAELWKSFVVASYNSFVLNAIPVVVSVTSFGVYVLLGNTLGAAQAFTSLTLLTVLRLPLFQLPQLITQLVNTGVGIRRIQTFLSADEQAGLVVLPAAKPGEDAVHLRGDYTWDGGLEPALNGLDLQVPAGHLVAIIGSTGSGKSSLLGSLLGLTQKAAGPDKVLRGTAAYVPQSAFLYNATVRDNILFGSSAAGGEVDEARYQEAIRVASLTRDLSLFPAGDLTELGDRGVNVSGGQKQRISIARAFYSNADVYLFDDPLSALDAKVARAVFRECMDAGLRGRTRLLVTNQLQFVSAADWVVFMADGRIAEQGTYRDLMADETGAFAQMMAQAEHDDPDEEVDEADLPMDVVPELIRPAAGVAAPAAGTGKKMDKALGVLVEKEGRVTGKLSWAVIKVYIRAMGGYLPFTAVMSWFVLVEVARIGTTVWLSVWTKDTSGPVGTMAHGALFYLWVYSLISAVQVVFVLVSQFHLKSQTVRAADVLHANMLSCLLKAPMSFFHTTPLGRTINRLTKDVSDVDKNLADFGSFYIRTFMQLCGTLITIAVTTPFALPAIVPVLLIFYLLFSYFQASVREVKRMDSISRSPVYGTIQEAINGLPTIRAFRAETKLRARNSELVNDNVVMSHVTMSMNRWLSVRLECMGALIAFFAAVLNIEQKASASTLGLTLTYSLTVTTLVSITVLLASVFENSFNAVERIQEYCELPEERAAEIPGSIPPHWPAKGKVEFRGVQMRYRLGLPLVLRGLDVAVQAGAKCGVVGRTGAGKSSLINCLFRLVELDGGSIVVDGIDIASVGLKQLRANLSLIPQVPVLFTGTIRANLDPFGEHGDSDIWLALRRAHLTAVVEASPLGLDMQLSEGGQPLSAGQKQLVALARALLRHSKVLVLDEATANVDVETDALIQKTVREEFGENTIIAVAHRLHTVIDCDSVLVMDAGQAGEFGTPAELLSIRDGIFSSMVADTGEATAAFLRSIAFGQLDPEAALALEDQAQRGLERVGKAPALKSSPLSAALVEKARSAIDSLTYALAALREDAASEKLRGELGMAADAFEGVDTATAHEALQQALQVVTDIESLAEQTRQYIARQAGLNAQNGSGGAEVPDAVAALLPAAKQA